MSSIEPSKMKRKILTWTTEVLKSLDTVTSYIKNPPQNLVFELKHINSINVIKNQISRHEINSKKQTTLERWFT